MAPAPVILVAAWTAVAAPAATGEHVRAALAEELTDILAGPAFKDATVGLAVRRLDDDATLFEHNAGKTLIPASNVKILTTSAALHYLSPDYRFRTEVYGQPDERGVVTGDLVIKGYGDPWLVPERVWYVATRLYFQGIRAVRGNIVVDDSYFTGPRYANGVEQDDSTSAYMAQAGALSVAFNSLLVHVLPAPEAGREATVMIDPASRYAKVEGTIETISRGRSSVNVEIEPLRDRSVVKVSGRISTHSSGRGYWRRVDNPAIYAGEVFKAMMRQVGINVRGRVVAGVAPKEAERLVTLSSPRLVELIDRVNKHSNNFMAAQIARTIGAEVYGAPGSWDKGRRAIESFLAESVGIARGTYELGNASGLHDVNRLSPRQVVKVLRYMYRQPDLRPEFLASMAVAGGSGTLSDRMAESEAAALLRAKTGTLSTASALSGYVTCRSGQTLAFSMLVNDYTVSIQDVWEAQDEIGAVLARLDFDSGAGRVSARGAP